jgi:hypothetical protein
MPVVRGACFRVLVSAPLFRAVHPERALCTRPESNRGQSPQSANQSIRAPEAFTALSQRGVSVARKRAKSSLPR